MSEVSYVLGPNASGKSNLLDVFRFLRDICKPQGGGLQSAIAARGGLGKLRCLHARRDPEVSIEVEIKESNHGNAVWRYALSFQAEGKGAHRIIIKKEDITHEEKIILSRPNEQDKLDEVLLTQTYLEQIQTNSSFREIVDFFSKITYLHLVPQLLKFAEKMGGNHLEDDPFGQGFLHRLAKTPQKTRDNRLNKIGIALTLAVPQFQGLRYIVDELGHPHLEAKAANWRPKAGWQKEEHFSDGTLRLLGLLWALLDGSSMLLLEEPEISLNDEIVKQIPAIIETLQKNRKPKRQILLSTHSHALLSNLGINPKSVIVIEPSKQGSIGRSVNDTEAVMLNAGFSLSETVLPSTNPKDVSQLGLWQQ